MGTSTGENKTGSHRNQRMLPISTYISAVCWWTVNRPIFMPAVRWLCNHGLINKSMVYQRCHSDILKCQLVSLIKKLRTPPVSLGLEKKTTTWKHESLSHLTIFSRSKRESFFLPTVALWRMRSSFCTNLTCLELPHVQNDENYISLIVPSGPVSKPCISNCPRPRAFLSRDYR